MTLYKVPLTPSVPQSLTVGLPSGSYVFRLTYADAPDGDGGWVLDISDSSANPLVCGVPLVTGADLLAQYAYLGLGVKLFVTTDGDPSAPPTFADLGVTANLYVETP